MLNAGNIFLAVSLITAPADSPVVHSANTEIVRKLVQQVAVSMEILDPREVRYVVARPEDFTNDINLLRRRYKNLKDAPLVCDSLRFPDREYVNEILAFNRIYRNHLDAAQPVFQYKWWWYQDAIQETDKLYHIWDTVRDGRCEYYYISVRREALQRLRGLIGEEAYFAGRLPPHVPIWRFQSAD